MQDKQLETKILEGYVVADAEVDANRQAKIGFVRWQYGMQYYLNY